MTSSALPFILLMSRKGTPRIKVVSLRLLGPRLACVSILLIHIAILLSCWLDLCRSVVRTTKIATQTVAVVTYPSLLILLRLIVLLVIA